jgi:hypothetical protein
LVEPDSAIATIDTADVELLPRTDPASPVEVDVEDPLATTTRIALALADDDASTDAAR